jgi:hypothetical protein
LVLTTSLRNFAMENVNHIILIRPFMIRAKARLRSPIE